MKLLKGDYYREEVFLNNRISSISIDLMLAEVWGLSVNLNRLYHTVSKGKTFIFTI